MRVLVYLGEQLGIEDVSQISQYAERRSTPFEHQDAIRKAYALKEFSQAEADFVVWASAGVEHRRRQEDDLL